ILNAVVGLCLLVGGLRHGDLTPNRAGTSAYLAMLVVLVSLAFALPAVVGRGGSYTAAQTVPVVVLTVALYAFFLVRQMGPQARSFREVDTPEAVTGAADEGDRAPRAGPAFPPPHPPFVLGHAVRAPPP